MAALNKIAGSKLPFLACIRSVFPKGVTVGTGTLITSRLLLTAGHVVYDPLLGGDATRYVVTIGDSPRRTVGATIADTTQEWIDEDSRLTSTPSEIERRALSSVDIGVVALSSPISTGAQILQEEALDPGVLTNMPLQVAGYTNKLFPQTAFLSAMKGQLLANALHRLTYPVSTLPGMSGGPVWSFRSGKRLVSAIHTSKYREAGNALILDKDLLGLIKTWRNEFP